MLSIKRYGKAGSVATVKGQSVLNYLKDAELSQNMEEVKKYYKIDAGFEWFGSAAKTLGLDGKGGTDFLDFERLACGMGPDGNALVRRAGEEHKMGDDFTFSSVKDVSTVFAAGDNETKGEILQIRANAVRESLAYIENIALTRLGKNGETTQAAAGIIVAKFSHFASRNLDPQLHDHCFLMNVALCQDGQFRTLETNNLYSSKKTIGALYRLSEAKQLSEKGYVIERDSDTYKIKGVSETLKQIWSSRSEEIKQALKESGLSGAKAANIAALKTRKNKSEPPLKELLEKWNEISIENNFAQEKINDLKKVRENKIIKDFKIDENALNQILNNLTKSESYFDEKDVIYELATCAVGHWDISRCLKEAKDLINSEHIIKLSRVNSKQEIEFKYTTLNQYNLELSIKNDAEKRLDDKNFIVDKNMVNKAIEDQEAKQGFKLNEEQKNSVHWICSETGGIACVEGWAGTGKTTMLTTVNKVFSDQGYSVIGCALQGKTALSLQEEANIPSSTIDSLVLAIDKKKTNLSPKTVIIIDEAAMLDSKKFRSLQERADQNGAKLVLVGDPKQIQPVEAGGIMKSMMDRTVSKCELNDIQRQKTDIKALRYLLKGKDSLGYDILTKADKKTMNNVPDQELISWTRQLMQRDRDVEKVFEKWKDRYDYQWMRKIVKDIATDNGSESKKAIENIVTTLNNKGLLNFYKDQKTAVDSLVEEWANDPDSVSEKMIVAGTNQEVFFINSRISEYMKKKHPDRETLLTFKKNDEQIVNFHAEDRIVFGKNDRDLGVKNGTLGTLKSSLNSNGKIYLEIKLDDGKTCFINPEEYTDLNWGWALTVNKSQGKTVNQCYVMDSETMTNREWMYVAASRARFKTKIYSKELSNENIKFENFRSLSINERKLKIKEESMKDLSRRIYKSNMKGTTLDFKVVDKKEKNIDISDRR